MFAAAGIVVTDMRTPISAPDVAVLRLSIPAAPAQAATKKLKKSGLRAFDLLPDDASAGAPLAGSTATSACLEI